MPGRPAYTADALGIGVATGVYGISFGVLAVGAGLSEAQACAMSLLVFTGGSQFAAISVIGAGGAAATAIANALLLAVRNGAYGLSLASLLRGSFPPGGRRQLMIDETTAMARAPGRARRRARRLLADRRRGVRVLERRDAGRGARRLRARRPRAATGSTRCSRPRSSRCSRRSCASPGRPPPRWRAR